MPEKIDEEELLAVTKAIHDADCDAGPDCGDLLTTGGRYARWAAAAIAEIRRLDRLRERIEP